MAVKNRKKYGARAGGSKRTEKQIHLARHKQVRKSTARQIGVSVDKIHWVKNSLFFVKTGLPVPVKVTTF